MQAGVVDRLPALGDSAAERPDAVAELASTALISAVRHPGLEVVQQRVVDVVEVVEALEALRVAALQLDVSLQVGQEGREVGVDRCASTQACSASEAVRVISARSSAGTRRAFSHSRRATRTRLASSDSYGRLSVSLAAPIEQPAELVGDQALVADPRQRRLLLGAGLGSRGRHLRSLVPGQQGPRPAEIADLGEDRSAGRRAGPPLGSSAQAGREALGADGVQDPLAVLGAVGLQDELDRRLADVELDALADVLDVDHVGAVLGDQAQQRRQRSGPVGDDRPEHDPPARPRSRRAGCTRRAAEASTLPPDSTTQVSPSAGGSTLPASSAATPAAPAPSTTSFERSSRSTIASATSSSETVDDPVEMALDQRQRQLAGALDRDPVADRARRAGADRPAGGERLRGTARRPRPARRHPRAPKPRLDRDRHPGGQPAAPERHDDQPRGRRLAGDLQPHAALAGDDLGIVEGGHERLALALGEIPRGLARLLVGALDQVDLAPVGR